MQLADIKHLAVLARLDIPDEEAEALLSDLSGILSYVDQVTEASIPESVSSVPEHRNECREDTITTETGAYTSALLAQVPDTQDGYVKVRKIIG